MATNITANTTTVSSTIVSCNECHQPVEQADAYTVGLLETVMHDGREALRMTQKTAEVCEDCLFSEAAQ